MNIQEVRTAARSPWQNAYVERVIGSIRRECIDHVIVVNAAGLHQVLTGYIAYYMQARTHLALEKDAPISRQVMPPSAGCIVATPQVGGLHHRYDRAAASRRHPAHSCWRNRSVRRSRRALFYRGFRERPHSRQ